jgi:predicted NBD/HSP70 family sugar kinase
MEDLSDQRWEEVVSRFSQGIVNLSVLIKPSVIVFGSSVSLNHPDKVERIYEQVKLKLKVGATPEFRVSSLGPRAGTVGAIALINCSENNAIAF